MNGFVGRWRNAANAIKDQFQMPRPNMFLDRNPHWSTLIDLVRTKNDEHDIWRPVTGVRQNAGLWRTF